jgi:hypothetical protein
MQLASQWGLQGTLHETCSRASNRELAVEIPTESLQRFRQPCVSCGSRPQIVEAVRMDSRRMVTPLLRHSRVSSPFHPEEGVEDLSQRSLHHADASFLPALPMLMTAEGGGVGAPLVRCDAVPTPQRWAVHAPCPPPPAYSHVGCGRLSRSDMQTEVCARVGVHVSLPFSLPPPFFLPARPLPPPVPHPPISPTHTPRPHSRGSSPTVPPFPQVGWAAPAAASWTAPVRCPSQPRGAWGPSWTPAATTKGTRSLTCLRG